MKQSLKLIFAACLLTVLPYTVTFAEGGPVTYFGTLGGVAELDQEAALRSASAGIQVGVKTNVTKDGSAKLVVMLASIDKPLLVEETSGDYVKSFVIGVEKYYDLFPEKGLFAESKIVLRGAYDLELNREDNDGNLLFGIGWFKALGAMDDGSNAISIQTSLDWRARKDEGDDLMASVTFGFTP